MDKNNIFENILKHKRTLSPSDMIIVWITRKKSETIHAMRLVAWVKREEPANLSTSQLEGHNLSNVMAVFVSYFALTVK
jgi:hypothetical protein